MVMKVVEECSISPAGPPPSRSTSLHLTFLDIPWLFFPQSQPLFFYHFPYPTSHFTCTLLPNLKLSLSLTLQHFYPFAGTLHLPPQPAKPEILTGPHDSVSFTVAESDGDLNHLSSCLSNQQRDVKELQALVPPLPDQHYAHAPRDARADKLPLMAMRVTVFPNSGFCLGLAFHHVVGDARTFNNFMKLWCSFCSSSSSSSSSGSIDQDHDFHSSYFPSYDRTVMVDTRGLEGVFLNEWWKRRTTLPAVVKGARIIDGETRASTSKNHYNIYKVRRTFVMGLADMERIKSWVLITLTTTDHHLSCNNKATTEEEPVTLDLSPYVLTCAYIWVCVLKAQQQAGCLFTNNNNNTKCAFEDPSYFGFVAGGLTRVDHPIPATYLGNCVGFGRAMAIRGELLGDEGVLVAVKAIRNTVKRLDREIFSGAEKWILEWEELIGSDIHVMVSGSPKVDLYEMDFGWGRPKKIEEMEIDSTKAISLSESRDVKGGMEIGLVLPKPEMEAFTALFKEGLKAM